MWPKAFKIRIASRDSALETVVISYKKLSVPVFISKIIKISSKRGFLHFIRRSIPDGDYCRIAIQSGGHEIASEVYGLPKNDLLKETRIFNSFTECMTNLIQEAQEYINREWQ